MDSMAAKEYMNTMNAAQTSKNAEYVSSVYGSIGGTSPRPSLREEAEKSVGYHREQADRFDRAAAFFRENRAFDEFIQLIRSGVIRL